MEYKVFVKQEYIDWFLKNRNGYCPIMIAINEQTDLSAWVYPKKICALHPDWDNFREVKIEYKRAIEFIQRADLGKSLKPFEFIFNI